MNDRIATSVTILPGGRRGAGHVYPEVETVVRESDGYMVVEKFGAAGDMAEILSRDGALGPRIEPPLK